MDRQLTPQFIWAMSFFDGLHHVLQATMIASYVYFVILLVLHYYNLHKDHIQLDQDIKKVVITALVLTIAFIIVPDKRTYTIMYLSGGINYESLEDTNAMKIYIDFMLDRLGALK